MPRQTRRSSPRWTRAIEIDSRFLAKWSPTISFNGGDRDSLVNGLSFTRTRADPEATGSCVHRDIDVRLTEIRYEGDDLAVPSWSVTIRFEVGPPKRHSVIKLRDLDLGPRNPTYRKETRIYSGPGVYCGRTCIDSIFVFEIKAEGKPGGRPVLGGIKTKVLIYESRPKDQTLEDITVDVEDPEASRNASLHLRFKVRNSC